MTTATKPQLTEEQVYESLAGSGAIVDATAGVIKGVKVIGFESLNNRLYPADLLRKSVHLYEGARVFFDHENVGQHNATATRKYKDRFGSLKNARFVEGKGIFADHHYNPKHHSAEQYAWDAQNSPDSVGFSHSALMRFAVKPDAKGRKVVEEIGQVLSVDLVAEPATTKGLFESQSPSEEESVMDLSKITLEELQAARPDLLKAVESKTADADKFKAMESQLADAKKLIDQFTAEKKALQTEQAIGAELKAAGFDPSVKEHVSDLFLKQLIATEDAAVRKEMIADRAALLKIAPTTEGDKSGGTVTISSLPTKPVTTPSWGITPPAASIQRIRESCKDPKKFAAMCD